MRYGLMAGLAVVLMGTRTAEGQDLTARIAATSAERVSFTFAVKEGVCGCGDNINFGSRRGDDDRVCDQGPARVTLDLTGHTVTRVKLRVGGAAPAGAEDLGNVTPVEASDWLLALAARGDGRASEEAVMPAVIAKDVVVWPRLASMAKDRALREGTRKQAIFWLGQQAADQAVGPLEDLVNDDPDHEVKETALFALSQQHTDHAVDVLIRVAKTNPDRRLRRTAFFWLGQSEDPRGIQLFEDVLAGR